MLEEGSPTSAANKSPVSRADSAICRLLRSSTLGDPEANQRSRFCGGCTAVPRNSTDQNGPGSLPIEGAFLASFEQFSTDNQQRARELSIFPPSVAIRFAAAEI